MQICIAKPIQRNDFIQISSLSPLANNGNGISSILRKKNERRTRKKLLNFMNRKFFFCFVSSFVELSDNEDNFNGNQCPLL